MVPRPRSLRHTPGEETRQRLAELLRRQGLINALAMLDTFVRTAHQRMLPRDLSKQMMTMCLSYVFDQREAPGLDLRARGM